MATIPVEKKSGTPLWMWLLPLLLLAALLFYFLSRDNNDTEESAATDPAGQVDTAGSGGASAGNGGTDDALGAAGTGANAPAADGGAGAGGAAITTLADLDRALDGSATGGSLDGRPVRLGDARVTSVVGDSAFYVGTGTDRVLVILANVGEEETGAGSADGVFDVNEGDLVGLTGELKSYTRGMRGMSQLDAADQTEVGTRGYVVVTRPNGLTPLTQ
ncbi:MAG TPA: hypothetical protein VGB53_01100 [Rubricoccaceae bacterium]|jgi:hypothetical protein